MTESDRNESAARVTGVANQLPDAAASFAEAALEALHVEGLFDHIPVFKTTLAAANVVGSVRDHLLLRKIEIFLHAIVIIPAAERRDMVSRLVGSAAANTAAGAGYIVNVGEYLIELLDRVDGRRKPAMIGAVFAAFAFEQIDRKDLLRLNLAIQALPVMEIDTVRSMQSAERISSQAIANAGLAEPLAIAGQPSYRLNSVGLKFLELELDSVNPA